MSILRNNSPLHAAVSGLAAGVLLGLVLKTAEQMTGKKVYTLLLNIDYIPVLKHWRLSETIEFSLHLLVSVALSLVLGFWLARRVWSRARTLAFVTCAGVIIGLLLYPTTLLSDRTPEWADMTAFGIWMIGHLLYGIALGWLLRDAAQRTSQLTRPK